MTWGTHCPQCGRVECRWIAGKVCEGNLGIAMPDGFRVSVALSDNMAYGHYYYIEERKKGWFGSTYWSELEYTRGTLREALSKAGYHNPRTPLYEFWLRPIEKPV